MSIGVQRLSKPMNDAFGAVNYKKNFLKNVVARVDLLTPLLGVDVTLVPALGDLAVEDFPIPEPRDAITREVRISAAEVKSTQEGRFKEWRFQTYELVKHEFVRVLDRIAQLFPGVKSSRVGLRYVNLIEFKEAQPMEWSAYLAPQLLSIFHFHLGTTGWLFRVYPTGLVVSAPALVHAGAILDRRDTEGQRLLRACVAERVFDPKERPVPHISDFRRFAESVLGWNFSPKGYAGTAESPIPTELEVPLPDYGETLRPDFAVREPEPKDLCCLFVYVTARSLRAKSAVVRIEVSQHN
jgi:hypothetical protein